MKILSKLKIRSLYIKWAALFTGVIVVAQITTLVFTAFYAMPEIIAQFSERLYKKAEFVQTLYNSGIELNEETMENIGDTDIRFILLNKDTDLEKLGDYRDVISFDMLKRASTGEIVTAYFNERAVSMPYCLVAIGDDIAVLAPGGRNDTFALFIRAFQGSIVIGAVIASFMLVIVLIFIIRPIRKVTVATREVAKGNFDVELTTKSKDEVGQLIENFNKMTAELQKNEYLKKDFVSSVSHEFKTPITSIEGFAKLLQNQELSFSQVNEYTDIIIKEAGRLSKLASNLLKLSVLDASGFEPAKSEFRLDEQIRNVVLLLENLWEEKEIDLDIDLDVIRFYGNEELLSQVWINLIQNAVKFSKTGGKITISAKEIEAAVKVTVADEGEGIPAESMDKIFDRFYKGDKSRSKEGNGLGLSIVKRIVEIAGGNIVCESRVGQGTTFVVSLSQKNQ